MRKAVVSLLLCTGLLLAGILYLGSHGDGSLPVVAPDAARTGSVNSQSAKASPAIDRSVGQSPLPVTATNPPPTPSSKEALTRLRSSTRSPADWPRAVDELLASSYAGRSYYVDAFYAACDSYLAAGMKRDPVLGSAERAACVEVGKRLGALSSYRVLKSQIEATDSMRETVDDSPNNASQDAKLERLERVVALGDPILCRTAGAALTGGLEVRLSGVHGIVPNEFLTAYDLAIEEVMPSPLACSLMFPGYVGSSCFSEFYAAQRRPVDSAERVRQATVNLSNWLRSRVR